MPDHEEIVHFIDNTAYLYTDYVLQQLKKEDNIRTIAQIIDQSHKEVSEAVLVYLAAIKYTFRERNVFAKLEENDSFQDYIKENFDSIFKLSLERSVQGNLPERALPILELLKEKLGNSSTDVIELGASLGLVGYCLLNPRIAIKRKDRYFSAIQKVPDDPKNVNYYLGVELNPPDEEWILACVEREEIEVRLKCFIDDLKDIQSHHKFELLKGDAFGFSDLTPVKKISEKSTAIVVLTSFLLYQFDEKKQKVLKDEIFEFINKYNGHWINQAVKVSLGSTKNEYYIEWDGKRVIELIDDSCRDWKWIE